MREYRMPTAGTYADRTYAEIDISALRRNISLVREKVGSGVKILCLVKADAYGHGAVQVARRCEDLLDFLGVATVDEGIELRRGGIALPILVVGDVAGSRFQDAVDNDISLTVHNLEGAKALSEFCKAMGTVAKVHIAVDSGMGRIGFLPDEVDRAVEVSRLEGISIEGIFTHFAKADESDKAYTYMQKAIFDGFVEGMRTAGVDVGLRHVSNSASILDIPEFHCDMVRMGIMTYGLYPSGEVGSADLLPAMSLHTHIIHLKTLPRGSCVSYGGDYVAKRETKVATIGVGYGDGYPRALSGKGFALVRGRRAAIIGRICMDQTMLDVSHIPDVQVGDKVTLIGTQGGESITADEVARLVGTINYEIVCSIAPRVPRIYI